MKKFIVICLSFIFCVGIAVVFAGNNKGEKDNAYLRIHVRANSNNQIDQEVKYKVKDAVVDYLTPLIAEGSTFEQAYEILQENLLKIEEVANNVLISNGFNYLSKALLRDEYFPTRSYGEYTLENGFYDALILELGEGVGNNWWCVVYPPLCFIGSEGTNPQNVRYKSKMVEIIQEFFS